MSADAIELMWLALAVLLAFVITDLAMSRAWYAMQGGTLDVLVTEGDRFRFRSDFGLIDLDEGKDRLSVIGPASSRVVPAARVRSFELRVVEALLDLWQEFLLGFAIEDLFRQYRDRVRWHVVVAVLDDGREIPRHAAGQLHRREIHTTALHERHLALMWRIGVAPNVPALARGIRDQLSSRVALRARGGTSGPGSARSPH